MKEPMAIARGHFEVMRKAAAKEKFLLSVLREYREVIEEMDKEIRKLKENK